MIWLARLASLALGAGGSAAIGFLVYQRMGAAVDLPGCISPSWSEILDLDGGAMAAFALAGLLLLWRPRPLEAAHRETGREPFRKSLQPAAPGPPRAAARGGISRGGFEHAQGKGSQPVRHA